METAALVDWFEPEELEDCPSCGEHAALSLRATTTMICFACGFIAFPGGTTSVSAVQGRAPELADDLAPSSAGRRASSQREGTELISRSGDTRHQL